MSPEPPRGKGPCSPFSGHSCLLHLQWSLITKVIETTDKIRPDEPLGLFADFTFTTG